MLLLAECYAFAVLLLGYMQMLWPLGRKPVPLPDDLEQWPAVDVLIPTLNEPPSVVRFTALAAMNIDWPADKLNVYILDDGHREEFRAFAEEAGIGYITRDDNRHAKAGNINHALAQIGSPFVAIFDSDHVPTRSFLQVTMGWFLRDRKLGLMQTPHYFYSPDPFERNLGQFRVAPNEGELFYGIVQDGNDFWNAAFFCGSCAVIRRAALDEVGGIAVETVTEDAHTSLRMQMRGWNTAYINIPQAAGLATERLSGHVRQRIRWARGMVQVLRIENPLFAPGLKPAQRLCYFNAMSHFLYALPRLIFLTAPLIYLIFGRVNIPGYWLTIVAYAAPHLVLSNLTNSRVQGRHRHSFWNDIYETVLAPYIFLPTVLALFSTRTGSFNVTAKGGVVSHEYFDARIARPFLVLLGFDLFGLLCAIPRAVRFPVFNVTRWLRFVNWPASIYDGGHPGTIFMNVLWLLFSVALLGVATAVARESVQRRQSVRITKAVPSDILLPDGYMAQGITCNLSNGGVLARIHGPIHAGVGDPLRFVFPLLDGTATLPATVVAIEEETLRAKFNSLNLQETEALAMILYSRADTWLCPREAREADHPMRSLGRILRLSLYGLSQTAGSLLGNSWRSNKRSAAKGGLAASVVPALLLGVLAGVSPGDARGAQAAGAPSAPRTAPSAASRQRAVAAARDDDNLNLLPRPFYDSAADRASGGADRLPVAAHAQGDARGGNHRVVVRHPDGRPSGALPCIDWDDPQRQRDCDRREGAGDSGFAGAGGGLRSGRGAARQPLRRELEAAAGDRGQRGRAGEGCDWAGAGVRPVARRCGELHRPEDAQPAPAGRRSAMAEHGAEDRDWRDREDGRPAKRRYSASERLHAPAARPLLRADAEPRVPSELPLQRGPAGQPEHVAGDDEWGIRQLDAHAAHRQCVAGAGDRGADPGGGHAAVLQHAAVPVRLPEGEAGRGRRGGAGKPGGRGAEGLDPRHRGDSALGRAAGPRTVCQCGLPLHAPGEPE